MNTVETEPTSTKRMLWVGVALTVALLLTAAAAGFLRQRASATPLPVYGRVGSFTLTNQNGQAVTLADLQGHVWVADIIFTRCAGPCPAMTRQMRDLQNALPGSSSARLVSLTTDPDFDTPSVLKTYAERFGADAGRWFFLTGTKREIGSLAIDSLKLTAVEKTPEERKDPEDLFIHSTLLVLVDAQGQLRGIYPTTGLDGERQPVTSQVIKDIRRLERTP